jgi:hypothetical protein
MKQFITNPITGRKIQYGGVTHQNIHEQLGDLNIKNIMEHMPLTDLLNN